MTVEELVARFPAEVAVGTDKPGRYLRLADHFALHGEPAGAVAAEAIERLEAEGITLWRGGSDLAAKDLEPAAVSAVYSTVAGSPLAAPTGQVFAQLEKGLRAEDYAADFHSAGYEIVRTIVYAPHAAWLGARTGDAALALRLIPELEALPRVASVEPQMLMSRALR